MSARTVGIVVLAAALAGPEVAAGRRLVRLVGPDGGLPVSWVTDVVQDAEGFLWLGTPGGIYRYDGYEARPWGRETLHGQVRRLTAGPNGGVAATDPGGRLYEVVPWGLRRIEIPEAQGGAVEPQLDALGRLWVTTSAGGLFRRDPGGDWGAAPVKLGGELPVFLKPARAGGVLVITSGGVWRVNPAGSSRKILTDNDLTAALELDDGTALGLRFDGELVAEQDGAQRTARHVKGRGIDLVLRGGVVWESHDRFLVGWRPGGAMVVLGSDDGVPSGGPLHVDREGTLWMATFGGLIQLPEPDAEAWTERDGLPSRHTRFAARSPEGLWVSTWAGLAFLDPDSESIIGDQPLSRDQLCVDASGAVWTREEVRDGGIHRADVIVRLSR